jgi:hypothetical protein
MAMSTDTVLERTSAKPAEAVLGAIREGAGRDQRIDFIRGFAMCSVVTVHIEIFSLLNFIFWERLGIVTGAELFVIASGVILGLVHRRTADQTGWGVSASRLIGRALQLYRVQVAVGLVIAILAQIPQLDMSALTTFTDRGTGKIYPLFPLDQPWHVIAGAILSLRAMPHQFQILGLYVALLALAPLLVLAFRQGFAGTVLLISWAAYFYGWSSPTRVTGALFEYGFPLLSWQILFVHAFAAGYFQAEIAWRLTARSRALVIAICALLSFGFMVYAQNNPSPLWPDWFHLSLVPPELFNRLNGGLFAKNTLGLLRLVNDAVFFVTMLWLLDRFKDTAQRALGWLLVPIGQASLYIFVMHLAVVGVLDQFPIFLAASPRYDSSTVLAHTLVHVTALLLLWLMIRKRFMFSIVPR